MSLPFLVLFLLPLAASAARYALDGDATGWRTADRSSAGLLRAAAEQKEAVVRVFGPHSALERHLREPLLDRRQAKGRRRLHPL